MKKQPKPSGQIVVIHSKNPLVNLWRFFRSVLGGLVDAWEMAFTTIGGSKYSTYVARTARLSVSATESSYSYWSTRIMAFVFSILTIMFVVYGVGWALNLLSCPMRGGNVERTGFGRSSHYYCEIQKTTPATE